MQPKHAQSKCKSIFLIEKLDFNGSLKIIGVQISSNPTNLCTVETFDGWSIYDNLIIQQQTCVKISYIKNMGRNTVYIHITQVVNVFKMHNLMYVY